MLVISRVCVGVSGMHRANNYNKIIAFAPTDPGFSTIVLQFLRDQAE